MNSQDGLFLENESVWGFFWHVCLYNYLAEQVIPCYNNLTGV